MADRDRWQELLALGDATAELRPDGRFAGAVMDAVRQAEVAAGSADELVRAARATAELRPAPGFVDAVVAAVAEGALAPPARASGRGDGTRSRSRTVRAGLAALGLAAAAAVAGLSWSFVAERQLDEAWIAVGDPVGGLE